MLLMITILTVAVLSACDGNGPRELGETFEFDGLEITLSEDIGFTRLRSRWSDHDGAYVFYIPTTVTNIGDSSNELMDWLFTIYSPDGQSLDSVSFEYSGTSISTIGSIQPNASKEGYIYVLFAEDGEYIITFDNFEETIEVHFELEFDFAAVPEIQTEFSLGETLEVEGIEITIADSISWGRINSRWSDLDGEYYFYLPVTITNVSDESNGFPWSFDIFGPNGSTLDSITWEVEADDISRAGDILPDASLTEYLHVLFAQDGEYIIEFRDWEFDDYLRVSFNVEFDPNAVPVVQTEFSLGESFVFDDLEITILDDISWGIIDSRWSNHDGEDYFYLPVTVTNIGSSSNSFPWNVTFFGSRGLEIDGIARDVDADDITRSGDIRAGATLEGYIHILFDGNGEYVIEFSDWNDEASVIFDVRQ